MWYMKYKTPRTTLLLSTSRVTSVQKNVIHEVQNSQNNATSLHNLGHICTQKCITWSAKHPEQRYFSPQSGSHLHRKMCYMKYKTASTTLLLSTSRVISAQKNVLHEVQNGQHKTTSLHIQGHICTEKCVTGSTKHPAQRYFSPQPGSHLHRKMSRAPDQNGVSQAQYIVEIHHSGQKPSMCYMKYTIASATLLLSTSRVTSAHKDALHNATTFVLHIQDLRQLIHLSSLHTIKSHTHTQLTFLLKTTFNTDCSVQERSGDQGTQYLPRSSEHSIQYWLQRARKKRVTMANNTYLDIIIIIMSEFLERLSMWNMPNCAKQVQMQKYKTHAYKTDF